MSVELNKSSGSESNFYNMSLPSFEPVQSTDPSLMSPTSPDQPAQSPTPVPRPRKVTMGVTKENERLKAELASKKKQIDELQSQISDLMESEYKRERERQEMAEKVTDLEESLQLMSLSKEKGPKKSDRFLVQKLEKAMKEKNDLKQEVVQLGTENDRLKAEVAKVSEEQLKAAEEEKKRLAFELEQTRHQLQEELRISRNEMETEKNQMKFQHDTEMAELHKKWIELKDEVLPKVQQSLLEKLQLKEQEACDIVTNLENKLHSTEQTLEGVQSELLCLKSEQSENTDLVGSLTMELERLQQEQTIMKQTDDKTIGELEKSLKEVTHNLEMTQSTLTATEEKCRNFKQQLSKEIAEKRQIHTEMKELESTCDDFEKEAESALTDYNEASGKLREIEEERDLFRQKANNYLRELTARNTTITQMETQLAEFKQVLKTERAVMADQLKVFEEDYRSERRAREDLVKKCTSLRERNQQLEQEKKGLHTQLNEQATQLAAQYAMQGEFEHSSDPDDTAGVTHPNYQSRWS